GGVVRRAGHQGWSTGGFGLLRVAQIHVARRATSSVHHARCADTYGAACRCEIYKSN
ncbi:hypothetical protein A2U01_0059521, partial [Trifolium medium]|nr:hypothetical protein [Trifolium medium]